MNIRGAIDKHKTLVSQLSEEKKKVDNLADVIFQKTKRLIEEYNNCWQGNPIRMHIENRDIILTLWGSELRFYFCYDYQEEDLSYCYSIETPQRNSSDEVYAQYYEDYGWQAVFPDHSAFSQDEYFEYRLMQIMDTFFVEAYHSEMGSYNP